jgi:hypothetical protein
MQQQTESGGVPKGAMGAKGMGWFVAGTALILIGVALWIGFAMHKTCPSSAFTSCLFESDKVGHPGVGAVYFLVLGGIGAVCLIAGYMSRNR